MTGAHKTTILATLVLLSVACHRSSEPVETSRLTEQADEVPPTDASEPARTDDEHLCGAFDSEIHARDDRFLLWKDGTLELELYIDRYTYERTEPRIRAADYRVKGEDASVELNLKATEIKLLLEADFDEWQKLGKNESELVVEVAYEDASGEAQSCTMGAVFYKVEPTVLAEPRPLEDIEESFAGEHLRELQVVDLGTARLHYWGDEITAEYFEKGASLGTRCFYSREKRAVEASCPLAREAVNEHYVLIGQNVIPRPKVWDYLRGRYEPFYADARRIPYSALGSVVHFETWTGAHTFQLSSACCGDSELFEYDIRERKRTRVSPEP